MTHDHALDAFITAFAADGFAGATLAAAARAGDTNAGAIAGHVAGRWEALDRFNRRLDLAALDLARPDATALARERLFDLIMARFDAAEPHKPACARLAADARRSPGLALALAAQLGRTANMLLGAADVGTSGPAGIARINGLAALLADVARVWLTDDEPDMGATMKALDHRLGQAERAARRFGGGMGMAEAPPPTPDIPEAPPATYV